MGKLTEDVVARWLGEELSKDFQGSRADKPVRVTKSILMNLANRAYDEGRRAALESVSVKKRAPRDTSE